MKNYLDVLQLLSLPVLVFIKSTKGDNPRYLCILFDQTHPLITKKNNAFSTLMAAPNPPKELLNYKFVVNTVAEFQVEYQNTRNKESFLKNMQHSCAESHKLMSKLKL